VSQCDDLAQSAPIAPGATLNAISPSWEGEPPGEPRRNPARPEPRPPGITHSRLDDAPSQEAECSASDEEPQDLQSDDGPCQVTSAQREETIGQPPASVNGQCSRSATVSDPGETSGRTSPVSESTNASTAPGAAQCPTDGERPSVSVVSESACDDKSILRNEATAAADEPRDIENVGTAELATTVETDRIAKLDDPGPESGGPNDSRVPLAAAVNEPRGDPVQVPSAPLPAPADAPCAVDTTAVQRPRRTLTPEQLVHNQRVARYRAMKGLPPN
jgi:hypothetical protein